jgi:hypothetical protein
VTSARATTLRRLLACLAVGGLLLPAGDALAADRSDPIPPSVGPPGAIGFYVNPAVPGLDPARVASIAQQSLARWGDTYLGLTTATPGVVDGLNVIGAADLAPELLGQMQARSNGASVAAPARQTCVPAQRELGDTVRRVNRVLRAKLRRDVLSRGRMRRRTVRRQIRVPKFTRKRAPVIAQLCTSAPATSNPAPRYEFDVLVRPAPASGPWTLGPALPAPFEYDFETNLLHELGHVSGLAHHSDDCDPATPMATGQANGGYWHAVDEWRLPLCAVAHPPAPAPTVVAGSDSGEPLPGAGARALAGQRILVNPRVPAGYDSARFVAVATRAITRAGGVAVDLTSAPPTNGDGLSVLGFAPLDVGILTTSSSLPQSQTLAAYGVASCRAATVRVRRQVVLRRFVRRSGLRLRRDVIKTRTRAVPGFKCTTTRRPSSSAPVAPELDLRINEVAIAWEFGPRLPTYGTRWDLETALLQAVMSAGGAPAGTACDTTTPNSAGGAAPGDWWRSSTEVSRAGCTALASTALAARHSARSRGGRTTTVHRASGLPGDVRVVP